MDLKCCFLFAFKYTTSCQRRLTFFFLKSFFFTFLQFTTITVLWENAYIKACESNLYQRHCVCAELLALYSIIPFAHFKSDINVNTLTGVR